MNSKMNDILFDALFQAAACQSLEDELSALETKHQGDYSFSEKHKQRMKVIFRRYKQRVFFSKAIPLTRKVAVIALVIFTAAFGSLMTVEAVRNEVTKVIVNVFDKFSNISFKNEDSALPGDITEAPTLLPALLPDGYSLISLFDNPGNVVALYGNANGETIAYTQSFFENDDSISFDNEHQTFEPILINGYEGLFAKGNESEFTPASLVWNDGVFTYHISGNLDKSMLLEIAGSLCEPE